MKVHRTVQFLYVAAKQREREELSGRLAGEGLKFYVQ
jgi:hypothetical protein